MPPDALSRSQSTQSPLRSFAADVAGHWYRYCYPAQEEGQGNTHPVTARSEVIHVTGTIRKLTFS